ncbi:class I SAM-dependent methyltransferase [Phyllobacterium sp. BT25]|uniref:Class I SAM-dependent methyltransferase n=1 Tax=Phyllobacterium pellucidum TaxID=2740464 RepID=A0A849VXR9_9HYPH|nr:class I SAM-dependent methyltransferase [Phyllobacterium pellucidum]NTS33087.1 class I SAM-dependent methyltransferase [Phyllobacterium pellucidum]
MSIEEQVARHYTHGSLEKAILSALIAAGKDIDTLTASDLAPIDEFHFGWLPATIELGRSLRIEPQMHLLDVGCGIGGPARYLAETYECRITGVDLTDEFVEVARALTDRCGLDDRIDFHQASALALPFDEGSFDAAYMIHVGMNIEDKHTLFAEVWRVLKPGGRFVDYDIMRVGDAPLNYPMPWAMNKETSFVETPGFYNKTLSAAGFEIQAKNSRRDLAIKIVREMQAKAAAEGPPVLSGQIIMGPTAKQRLANAFEALENGIIEPIEIVARA